MRIGSAMVCSPEIKLCESAAAAAEGDFDFFFGKKCFAVIGDRNGIDIQKIDPSLERVANVDFYVGD
jgi:hypothetical protein